MLNRLALSVAGAALLASLSAADAQVPASHADFTRHSLRAADSAASALVQSAGLGDGLLHYLTDSAVVVIPGDTLVRGRIAALRALAVGGWAGARMAWTPIRVDLSHNGRSGYSYGGGTMTLADGTSTPARYIAFWRVRDEQWKIEAFHFNTSPQPATPPPAGFFPPDAPLGPATSVDVAAALQAIMQADRDFAALAAARDPGVAFATWAAPDGALLGGVYGPEAIGAAFSGGGTLEWGPVAGGMADSGDLGYTVGTAVQRGANGRVGYSKYLTIWRRQPNGEWRWVVDGGNPRPADAPTPAPE
jgi:ketosteroid isomerase-like protein